MSPLPVLLKAPPSAGDNVWPMGELLFSSSVRLVRRMFEGLKRAGLADSRLRFAVPGRHFRDQFAVMPDDVVKRVLEGKKQPGLRVKFLGIPRAGDEIDVLQMDGAAGHIDPPFSGHGLHREVPVIVRKGKAALCTKSYQGLDRFAGPLFVRDGNGKYGVLLRGKLGLVQ